MLIMGASATVRLAELRLDGNRFTGLLPAVRIGYATTLSVLEFSGNALEGSLPATISRLTKLKTLRAFNNRLEGPVPPALEGMRIAELQLFPQQGCRGSVCQDADEVNQNCTKRKVAGECTSPNGATASFRGSLPPKPIADLSAEQTQPLAERLAALSADFAPLRKHPRAADADIFLKAVRHALEFHEWYDKKPSDSWRSPSSPRSAAAWP
jgi:hypothetical protein